MQCDTASNSRVIKLALDKLDAPDYSWSGNLEVFNPKSMFCWCFKVICFICELKRYLIPCGDDKGLLTPQVEKTHAESGAELNFPLLLHILAFHIKIKR
jgi:hypothetical protein